MTHSLQAFQDSLLPGATPQVSGKVTLSVSLLCEAGPTEVKIARRQSRDITEAVIPGVVCDLEEDPGSGGSRPRAAHPEGASVKVLRLEQLVFGG